MHRSVGKYCSLSLDLNNDGYSSDISNFEPTVLTYTLYVLKTEN